MTKVTYPFTVAAVLVALFCASAAPAVTPERLQQYLKTYPEADTNKDGKLSEEEARAYYRTLRRAKPAPDAAKPTADTTASGTAPTFANAAYGPDERNVLDFWKAKSDRPTPVVVFIHGGGFRAGDKSMASRAGLLQQCLDAGVSYAAINYRYRTTAPIQDVLRDCARAIQFLRSKATEWNIDKSRIASHGGSAGAGTSLWLAFHDDLADPQSADPVLRESSRLACAGSASGQFSYDILKWTDAFGEETVRRFGKEDDAPGFYGLKSDEELRGPLGAKLRADCDMLGLITRDDPPVFLSASRAGGEITDRGAYLHHPKHSQLIYDRCRELGVTAIADLPGLGIKPAPGEPNNLRDFFFLHLKVKNTAPPRAEK